MEDNIDHDIDDANSIIKSMLLATSTNRFWQISINLLILSALIIITSGTVADADLWGHLRFGLDMLESGKITQIDPYSYLSVGQRWINHEWLAEVAFAIAWLAAGSPGLIILKTTFAVLSIGFVYIYLLRQDIPPIRAGSLIVIASLGIFPAIATIRPHMFTLFFTTCTFIIIAQADRGYYKWLWATPIIFALWVNFHGGFLAGLGFLVIWATIHTLIHRKEWMRILPPIILSALAVLINPYGFELIVFLLRTATIPRPEIIEWQPLQPISILGGIYLMLAAILILGLIYSRKEKNKSLMLLLAVAILLPFIAKRHLPIYSLAMLVFGGIHIADAWSRIIRTRDTQPTKPIWLLIIFIILAFCLLIGSYKNFLEIPIPNDPDPYFPIKSIQLLKQTKVEGNLAIPFNWGEYAIWHLGPGIKVSMDGRRETVYSDDIYQTNLTFQYGNNDWDSLLENYETDFVLVPTSQPAYNLVKMKPGWVLIYEDSTSSLFAAQDWAHLEALISAAEDFEPVFIDNLFP